ncbi:MAG: phage holin family protein [Gemmatimonadaceae bacterium]|nr:phage holin family protein [Chitinophagaceae bacterium]
MEQEKPVEQPHFFKDLHDLVQQYIADRLLMIKLQMAEKSARVVSLVFTGFGIALLSFFVLLFLGLMGGYYFTQLTDSHVAGFGIMAGIFLLLALIMIALRKKVISKFISDMVIRIFFDQTAEDDDDEIKK